MSEFIPHTVEIECPSCETCGTPMWLSRIEPDKPDHDKRTFECPTCKAVTTKIVKYK